jgi:hypothetical protein
MIYRSPNSIDSLFFICSIIRTATAKSRSQSWRKSSELLFYVKHVLQYVNGHAGMQLSESLIRINWKIEKKKKSLQIFKLYFVIGLRGSTWEVHVHVTEYVLKVLIWNRTILLLLCNRIFPLPVCSYSICISLCDCQWFAADLWFSPGTQVSSLFKFLNYILLLA